MADSGSDFSQVKSSYDDVNTALENLLGNVQGGNSANYASKSDIANLQNQLNNFVGTNPVGTILPFSTSTIPNGYLLCNGATFSQTNFPSLYTAIGTSTLPDLRGMFLRGLDTSGNVDRYGSNRALLSSEEGSRICIDRGGMSVFGWGLAGTDPNTGINSLANLGFDPTENLSEQHNLSYTLTSSGSFTQASGGAAWFGITRPKNVAVNYIIKAVP